MLLNLLLRFRGVNAFGVAVSTVLSGSGATGWLTATVSSDFTSASALRGEVVPVPAVERLGSFDVRDKE
jgi:hypothetical protein